MLKLVHGKKNKIIKLQPPTYDHLRRLIGSTFSDAPSDFCLTYLDADKDEICLTSDEDLQIMMAGGLKVTKVFVKQSLTQTLVIEPEFTEQISIDFEEKKPVVEKTEEKKEEVEEIPKMVKRPEKVEEVQPDKILKIEEPFAANESSIVEKPSDSKTGEIEELCDESIDKV